jgi:hypothetical protein
LTIFFFVLQKYEVGDKVISDVKGTLFYQYGKMLFGIGKWIGGILVVAYAVLMGYDRFVKKKNGGK